MLVVVGMVDVGMVVYFYPLILQIQLYVKDQCLHNHNLKNIVGNTVRMYGSADLVSYASTDFVLTLEAKCQIVYELCLDHLKSTSTTIMKFLVLCN